MQMQATAIQKRVLEASKDWDVERLRSEVELMILTDNDEQLANQFFDDVATEEEQETGQLAEA